MIKPSASPFKARVQVMRHRPRRGSASGPQFSLLRYPFAIPPALRTLLRLAAGIALLGQII